MAKKRESRASRKERQRKRLSGRGTPNVSSVNYALPAVEEPTHNGEPVNAPSLAAHAPANDRAVRVYLLALLIAVIAGLLFFAH